MCTENGENLTGHREHVREDDISDSDILIMARQAHLPHWYQTNELVNREEVLKFARMVIKAARGAL